MRNLILAAGAAALAVSVPALADRGGHGGSQGGGQGGGPGGSHKDSRGAQSVKPDRGGQSMRQSDRGHGREVQVAHTSGGRDHGYAQKSVKHENRVERSAGGDVRADRQAARGVVKNDRDNRHDDGVRIVSRDFGQDFVGRGRGLVNGCPPGLDRKDNGCLPPGQARKLLGSRLQSTFVNSLLPQNYRSWYRDDNDHFYRAGDGFIYQVNRSNSLIDGIIPLVGGGNYYTLGDAWPDPYNFYNVPYQYRNYYADTDQYGYRYGGGAIYQVNAGSGVVESIVALLAGDLGVGRPLPVGYDAYNVPMSYRDRYYDTADNWYRYNDGYIYQVDPKTRLISAVIDAII
jgi:hypothetical protein